MRKFLYSVLYQAQVNFLIRNLLKLLPFLPDRFRFPPSGKIKVGLGRSSFELQTNQTCYVTHLIFWKGANNFEYTPFFIRLIQQVSTFYDIGANIGYYSILAGQINKSIKIWSFEPANGPTHYLSKNVALNKLIPRVQIVKKALSDQNGEIEFQEVINKKYPHLKFNLSGEGNLVNKQTAKDFHKSKVESLTMDDFCKMDNSFPELIKLDTEGAEILVLKGGIDTIRKFRPIIICEILYKSTETQAEFFFNEISGYKFYALNKSTLVTINTLQRDRDNGFRDFIFCPSEKTHLLN